MEDNARHQALACGGCVPPHRCAHRPPDETLGEDCPRLLSCLRALHPLAPCVLIRFALTADGAAILPFATENFEAVQNIPYSAVRDDPLQLFSIMHAGDYDRLEGDISRAAREVTPWVAQYRIQPGPWAPERWLRTCLLPHRAGHGLVGYGVITDVTAEQQGTLAIQALSSDAPVGIFRSSPDGRYLSANQRYAEMCGYSSPEELIRETADITAQFYMQPEEREVLIRLVREHGAIQRYALELRKKDGSSLWISLNVRCVRGADGNVESCEGYCADITAQVEQGLLSGRLNELERTRFGEAGTEKPASIPSSGAGGLCPLLSYVRDAILWRVRLPVIP